MYAAFLTETPHLTSDSFESTLASDKLLALYFNDFLSLTCFSGPLLYNQETGLFEVVNGPSQFFLRKIQTVLKRSESQILTADLARVPPVDGRYTVCRLDGERGIQWLKTERLRFFLQSDYYYEYRLAKLLLQWYPVFCSRRKELSFRQTTFSSSQLQCSHFNKESVNVPKAQRCSHSQESTSAKQGFPCHHEQSWKLHSSQGKLSRSAVTQEQNDVRESYCQKFEASEKQLEYLSAKVVNQVLQDAVKLVRGQSQANGSDYVMMFGHQTHCTGTDECKKSNVLKHSGDEAGADGKKEKVQDGTRGGRRSEKTEWHENTQAMKSRSTNQENALDVCWSGACCSGKRPVLDEFKEFLQGTPGEKLLNLWMDIERLKATQNSQRKNRLLVLMRCRYLGRSSPCSLNVELLSRMGLTTSPCWTEEKLCSVQSCLMESLLCYWAPRFWSFQCLQGDPDESSWEGLWRGDCCHRPLPGTQPCLSSKPKNRLHSDTCFSQFPYAARAQLFSSRRRFLCGRRMKMVQALSTESSSGSYFTHFCQQSGNQLWVNTVYFWTDLQHYHKLFYCGPDPYQVQREAQLLYSVYIFSSASNSINVDPEIQREVYRKLQPAFEELFDDAEEHALNILLEPWTLLMSRDRESLQQVCVQEEVCCIDRWEHREHQSLCEEPQLKLGQVCQLQHVKQHRSGKSISVRSMGFPPTLPPSTHPSKGSQVLESLSGASPNYHGNLLGSLFGQRHEISHFRSFLEKQDARIHLMCWFDLEQYRRTSQNGAIRQERSSYIASKYLNKTYFFGPNSPATVEQQNNILALAGGLEHLKLVHLSDAVVVEIQNIIGNHIEETWLPKFLSTKEFLERQEKKQKLQKADGLSGYRRSRAARGVWKAQGLWMNVSKEIMLFRRFLLNPSTCQRFQDFVSVKGGFLENDVRFWVEVQKYKDLCHSHSDEATIQQKISTIISCFINSSMPPTLQIDIPPDQAQSILEKRHELGPYIFRDAQASVFSELLRFWPEFQELSNSVQEDQLLPLLKKKQVKYRARERRQRRKEEEEDERRGAQGELKRSLCFRGEEDETDSNVDMEQEEIGETPSRAQSRMLLTSTHTLLWSYSKYMAGLKSEEMLLNEQSQLGTSSSTATGCSTDCSFKSASSKRGFNPPSNQSSRSDSKQSNRSNRK